MKTFLAQTPVITPIIAHRFSKDIHSVSPKGAIIALFIFLINIIFTLDFVICTKMKPSTCLLIKKNAAALQFWHHATGRRTSVSDKVGGEDADAPVIQLPLPPVVLRVRLGDDGDSVARGDAQVAGLLTGERVDGRDHQLTDGSAHWRTVSWGGEMVHASFKGAVQHSHLMYHSYLLCHILASIRNIKMELATFPPFPNVKKFTPDNV